MRDHSKLQAFKLADNLALTTYRITKSCPREEQFGLTAQIRRAVVSIGSNIVEGSARHSESDYIRFLDIAYGSACELEFQISLAVRLGYLEQRDHLVLKSQCQETAKVLNGLLCSLRRRPEA